MHTHKWTLTAVLTLTLSACVPASGSDDLTSAFDVFSGDNPVWVADISTFNAKFGNLIHSFNGGRYKAASLDLFRQEPNYAIYEVNDGPLYTDSILILWGVQADKVVTGIYDIAPGGTVNERLLVSTFRTYLLENLDKSFARGRLDQ